jgi:hypothetical protein
VGIDRMLKVAARQGANRTIPTTLSPDAHQGLEFHIVPGRGGA